MKNQQLGLKKPRERAAGNSLGDQAHALSHPPSASGAAWSFLRFSLPIGSIISLHAEEDPADLSFTSLELKGPVESDWPTSPIPTFLKQMVSQASVDQAPLLVPSATTREPVR